MQTDFTAVQLPRRDKEVAQLLIRLSFIMHRKVAMKSQSLCISPFNSNRLTLIHTRALLNNRTKYSTNINSLNNLHQILIRVNTNLKSDSNNAGNIQGKERAVETLNNPIFPIHSNRHNITRGKSSKTLLDS
mgnify:CR=1 FL=1